MRKKKSVKAKPQSVIYVGPQFKDGEMRTFKFYREIPARFAEDPVYKHLFVPPDKLVEAREQIARKGTALNIFYQQAVAAHQKEEGGM